jgi:hypothetical protein
MEWCSGLDPNNRMGRTDFIITIDCGSLNAFRKDLRRCGNSGGCYLYRECAIWKRVVE